MSAAAGRPTRAELWSEHFCDRERSEQVAILLCAVVLVPVWIVFDRILAPELLREFALLRAVGTLAPALAALTIRRSQHPRRRALVAFFLGYGTSAATIAIMLPLVTPDAFPPYLFGYTLYAWAVAISSSSIRVALPMAIWTSTAFALAWALAGQRFLTASGVMGGFYIASSSVIAVASSMTRRRMAYREFATLTALRERNDELRETVDKLRDTQARLLDSEKRAALGRLLAGVSHELKNPLNAVANNIPPVIEAVDALSAAAPGGRPVDRDWYRAEARQALDEMEVAAGRMRQILTDLRTFVRGDVQRPTAVDVGEGIRSTVALIQRQVPSGVTLTVEIHEVPPVAAQPGQLNQVWHNLVENALDAVGVRGAIRIAARLDGGAVAVTIEDTGPGVSPQARLRLFEPFFTTKPIGKGTGLGLAVSCQIVERHGGEISLDPSYANGARFVVRLPVGGRASQAEVAA